MDASFIDVHPWGFNGKDLSTLADGGEGLSLNDREDLVRVPFHTGPQGLDLGLVDVVEPAGVLHQAAVVVAELGL